MVNCGSTQKKKGKENSFCGYCQEWKHPGAYDDIGKR